MTAIKLDADTRQLLTWGAIAAVGLWAFGPQLARILTREAARTVVSIPISIAEGTVVGIGEAIGIPETDVDKCAAAVAEGRWWDASFYCPAGTFLREATGAIVNPSTGETVGYSDPTDAPQIISIEPVETTPTEEAFREGYPGA